MSWNSFGEAFRITTFGESHGPALGVVLDGVAPGLSFDLDQIQADLDRRRPGGSPVSSPRPEMDRVQVLSGVFEGRTTGAPICLVIANESADPAAYEPIKDLFRPGHADLTYWRKYGIRDWRGGGRSSGRETVARVAAGAVARGILEARGVTVIGFVREVAGIAISTFDEAEISRNPLRCPDAAAAAEMASAIESARRSGDSVGGVVEVRARGVPAGWGDPVFHKLDARLASAFMGIGAVKGVEIGDGFALARCRGSESNDAIDPGGVPETNRHGGVLGGISSGAEVVARLAVKPTPSIAKPQRTIETSGRPAEIRVGGRHDPCICPRLVPVAEAMMCLVLVDAMLCQRAVGSEPVDHLDLAAGVQRLDLEILVAAAQRRRIAARLESEGTLGHGFLDDLTATRREAADALGLDQHTVDSMFRLLEEMGDELRDDD
jgi:chorismate synthase